MKKKRADVLLFEKGLVDSREKARRIIMEGVVFVGSRRIDKPGEKINIDNDIIIKDDPIHYVSRGGLKLEKAIDIFNIDLEGKVVIDIGASTGGFTDCMLKNGAKKVFAIDVGYGQLDWNLRNDPRVIVKERTNIRYVTKEDIGELVDFISIDVSFISLKLVLPVAKELLNSEGYIMALIKPQFEAGRNNVGKKGLVKDKMIHKEVIENMVDFCNTIDLNMVDLGFSPITGGTGNIEFLSYINKGGNKIINEEKVLETIEDAHRSLY
ncbi:TlyA family RNA methyltransferase [Schnuerera ultunensis]|uniref:Putative 2'-O-ribose RNA methyltransferase n=1 Tax=[Clostridium] ultunense Esp TaxID=1288971 RepID=A0A1M4PNW4_9FIRM|nr:TlyA family RNA methyltransferase [Schnuerera ultunensis]SHD77153.1 putative 2'-O-ribose RNA methyltransferase [[Clostridium] ultunense Esp]